MINGKPAAEEQANRSKIVPTCPPPKKYVIVRDYTSNEPDIETNSYWLFLLILLGLH